MATGELSAGKDGVLHVKRGAPRFDLVLLTYGCTLEDTEVRKEERNIDIRKRLWGMMVEIGSNNVISPKTCS